MVTIHGQTQNMEALEVSAKNDLPALLIGETGCGKTTMIRHLAGQKRKKLVRFNLTGETTVDEFVGKYTLNDNKTVWEDGVLIQAMKNGSWLLVDEVNAALPEILFVLQSLLDDDKYVMLSHKDGEIIKPKKGFRFFAAMNPVTEYMGTKELNKSFLSRFPIILNIGYPSRADETKILMDQAGVSEETAIDLVETGNKLRALKREGKIFYTCSTRDLIQWGKLIGDFDCVQAFQLAIANKAIGEEEEVIAGFEQACKELRDIADKLKTYEVKSIVELEQKLEQAIKDYKDKSRKAGEKIWSDYVDYRNSQVQFNLSVPS